MARTYTYRDCLISRNANPRGLRWQAHCAGRFIYADTLDGIRALITATLGDRS